MCSKRQSVFKRNLVFSNRMPITTSTDSFKAFNKQSVGRCFATYKDILEAHEGLSALHVWKFDEKSI